MLGFSALAFYVFVNVVLVNVLPVVHRLSLQVEVVTSETSRPVSGATVAWAYDRPHSRPSECGTTDSQGRLEFLELIQENPYWLWPCIGTFTFKNRILQVSAPGFVTERVVLSDALPDLPYKSPTGHVRVLLRPQ